MRKPVLTVIISFCAVSAATAQIGKSYILPALKDPVILKKEKQTAPKPNTILLNAQKAHRINGSLIGQTPSGNLYSIQPDNMPVVVPDFKQLPYMPGAQKVPKTKDVEPMPNPFDQRQY